MSCMTYEKAVAQIYKLLCEKNPRLEGRKYKNYAEELRKQRNTIADIVSIFRAANSAAPLEWERK